MLYIKTESANKRTPLPNTEHIRAEDVWLTPDPSLTRMFDGRWNGSGVFAGRDNTDDDHRENYEHFRRVFRNSLNHPAAQASLHDICTKANNGQDIVLTVKESRKFCSSVRRLLVELFHEMGIQDIKSPGVFHIPAVRDMDPLTGKPQINTCLHYIMTGQDGTDIECTAVIIGEMSMDDVMRIQASCKRHNNELLFIPAAVGLPVPQSVDKRNHPWAKGFAISSPAQDLPRETTSKTMVRLFEGMTGGWDASAARIQSGNYIF